MKQVKHLLAILLSSVLLLLFAGCGQTGGSPSGGSTTTTSPQPSLTIKGAVLKGPTGIGMVKLMEDAKQGKTKQNYSFSIYGAPDQITGRLLKGELDVAALPTNAAATLYQKSGGKVQIAAINTLGVLYLLENTQVGNETEETTSLSYLKDQTLHLSGKGSTPQYLVEYLLAKNNLTAEDVTVEYQTEHTETMANLVAGKVKYAILPQPFVTVAQNKSKNVRVVTDLNAAWEQASGGAKLAMGCLVVRTEFAKNHSAELDQFLEEYAASTLFAINQTDETAALCGAYELMDGAVAKQAVPKCAVTCIRGAEMKEMAAAFLKVLADADATSVGGKLPDDAFYYGLK